MHKGIINMVSRPFRDENVMINPAPPQQETMVKNAGFRTRPDGKGILVRLDSIGDLITLLRLPFRPLVYPR
jgi:hypothetical protein